MALAILTTLLAYALTFTILEGWRTVIVDSYEITYQQMVSESGIITEVKMTEVSENGNVILNILQIVSLAVLIGYPVIAVCVTSHLYYQKKLKGPLERMVEEAEYIGRDDLSLPCQWESEDEMGKACEAMEKMRRRLAENQKDTWELMEQQRSLNAAFAHDMRTPLTVMQGYTELLLRFYPQGKISQEKMTETLEALDRQVKRMKNFAETMRDINTLDEREVKKERHLFSELEEKVSQSARGMEQLGEIAIEVRRKEKNVGAEQGYFDEELMLEVLENLLANALRYAKKKVEVQIETSREQVCLFVRDDGKGFSEEELYQATKPYYTDPAGKEEGMHWGIGLTICKMLCKKHGGDLTLSNSVDGGAIVCAAFWTA